MMHHTSTLVACVTLASILASAVTWFLLDRSTPEDDVFIIGAVTVTHPERLAEYQAVAGPLAERLGGYEPLAFSAPLPIEGGAPTPGLFFVERYDSATAMRRFIDSAEFKKAKRLRDEVADVHFMIAIDAYEH